MSSPRPLWRFHLGLALAETICAGAFSFELSRAAGGNALSWAYVFEWPLFGGYALFMWRQLCREARGEPSRPRRRLRTETSSDEAMKRYNAYLDEVHRTDSSG